MQIWRSPCGSYTVVLEATYLEQASYLARDHYPNEVGTSLVGSYSDDGWQAIVREVAPLTTDSKGGIAWFMRGMRGLRSFFAKLYTETNGMSHYIGEWHSHPDGAPVPSPTDDDNMMDIARDRAARCPECVLVLIALRDDEIEPAVYVYSQRRGRVDLVQQGE